MTASIFLSLAKLRARTRSSFLCSRLLFRLWTSIRICSVTALLLPETTTDSAQTRLHRQSFQCSLVTSFRLSSIQSKTDLLTARKQKKKCRLVFLFFRQFQRTRQTETELHRSHSPETNLSSVRSALLFQFPVRTSF